MEKPINENCSNCARPNGTYWKKCPACRANKRRWDAANPEKKKANDRRWAAANPEKIRASQRRWAAANHEKIRASQRKKYAENPYKYIDNARAWAIANPEKKRANDRRWVALNPERKKANERLCRHNRRMDKLSRGEYPRCPDGRRIWEMLTGLKLGAFAND